MPKRNAMSRFGLNPRIDRPRSQFLMNHSHKTTLNAGDLVPVYVQECYPGDTHTVRTNFVLRLQTLLTPIMDNLYLDTFFFFVPFRLIHEHFVNIMGENSDSAWIPQQSYSVPQTSAPSGGFAIGSLADYFGWPPLKENYSGSSYYFRSYAKIVEDWFRDQNVQDPINISTGDSNTTGSNGSNYITDLEKGGMPFIVSRYKDYFSTCLPDPQRGQPVEISLGGNAPVFGDGSPLAMLVKASPSGNSVLAHTSVNLTSGEERLGSGSNPAIGDASSWTSQGTSQFKYTGLATSDVLNGESSGIYADLSSVTGISVNTLRLSFQMQKILESDARGGTRYISLLLNHFNVTSPDARLQRSEYLGGLHQPININQVVQNSETSNTPQGTVAAYSHTSGSHRDFTYSCVEHGVIIGVCCIRYDHSYQQGLDRMYSRKTRYDFYWPEFSNIGEQAVLNKEIFLQGSLAVDSDGNPYDDQVFGFNEAWADLRFRPSRVSAEMRSASPISLDSWHLADEYASLPFLSADWMKEDKTNVDRTLAVTSSVANQAFVDFYFQQKSARVLPLFSIPGLIDHM